MKISVKKTENVFKQKQMYQKIVKIPWQNNKKCKKYGHDRSRGQ
jgi:hypothetical protein